MIASKPRIGIYAGSFDPITKGHWDIAMRASNLVDELYIVVGKNDAKKTLFSAEERVGLINDRIRRKNIKAVSYGGFIVDFAVEIEANILFRGLRPHGDFESEYGLAEINSQLAGRVETVFLIAHPTLAAVSSSMVKTLHAAGRDVTRYASPDVITAMDAKLSS